MFDFIRNNAVDALPYGFTSTVPVSALFKWNHLACANLPELVAG
jgi:hypothetical protein